MSAADCERLRPYLLDYVVGELDPGEAERLQLEKHLADCIDCRAAMEELRGTGRALEAVRAFDSQLNEKVRQDISRRARQEAEKLRAAHGAGRPAPAGRPVPALAWLMLAGGTAAVLAGVALVPRLGLLSAPRGATVVASSGAGFPAEFSPGAAVSVPGGALLHLKLADGSDLKLRGPAEAALAGGGAPLRITRGIAWLSAGRALEAVGLEPLRRLELAPEAQAVIESRPADDEPACVIVLGGTVSYSAPGGDGQLGQNQTLTVRQGTGQPSVRPSRATELTPWWTSLPGSDGRGNLP
ncbi:MAG TPA: hypothetical protein PK280_15695 [Planctomycetota bacterium]|nr:hypothetical protein [Planctomycetota bacterium]